MGLLFPCNTTGSLWILLHSAKHGGIRVGLEAMPT